MSAPVAPQSEDRPISVDESRTIYRAVAENTAVTRLLSDNVRTLCTAMAEQTVVLRSIERSLEHREIVEAIAEATGQHQAAQPSRSDSDPPAAVTRAGGWLAGRVWTGVSKGLVAAVVAGTAWGLGWAAHAAATHVHAPTPAAATRAP